LIKSLDFFDKKGYNNMYANNGEVAPLFWVSVAFATFYPRKCLENLTDCLHSKVEAFKQCRSGIRHTLRKEVSKKSNDCLHRKVGISYNNKRGSIEKDGKIHIRNRWSGIRLRKRDNSGILRTPFEG
jgi:hypothetical protein